jgi:hypothetical protein
LGHPPSGNRCGSWSTFDLRNEVRADLFRLLVRRDFAPENPQPLTQAVRLRFDVVLPQALSPGSSDTSRLPRTNPASVQPFVRVADDPLGAGTKLHRRPFWAHCNRLRSSRPVRPVHEPLPSPPSRSATVKLASDCWKLAERRRCNRKDQDRQDILLVYPRRA